MKKFLALFLTWQRWVADAIRKYKSKHFEDRSQPARFVEYMVGSYQEKKKNQAAALNQCCTLIYAISRINLNRI